jgi:SAM-dependent methyltransferase
MNIDDVDSFVAESYDYVPHRRGRSDVGFFVEEAKEAGGPVLELGCGTGRVLIPVARSGIRIVGLDSSTHMLRVCRQRLETEHVEVRSRVTLLRADMREFDLRDRFNLVTMPFRSFHHLLTVNDQLACLSSIREHLAACGLLILDVNAFGHLVNGTVGQESGNEPDFYLPDGRSVQLRHRIVVRNQYEQVVDAQVIYRIAFPDGRQQRLVQALRLRYTSRFELEHLLARSGFELRNVYGGYDRVPFGTTTSEEFLVVAMRRQTRRRRISSCE